LRRIVAAVILTAAASLLAFIFFSDLERTGEAEDLPYVLDDSLTVELAVEGLDRPTSMRFLDEDNLIVLEQQGRVMIVSDGKLIEQPLLEIDVETQAEQGLLGIATHQYTNDVFLYLTAKNADDSAVTNSVYKFHYNQENRTLTDKALLFDLPGEPGPYHNGGKIILGADGRLYAVIGDMSAGGGILDNQIGGRNPNDRSVILRVDRETGEGPKDNPYYGTENVNLRRYFAYGIRNSFGLDFDPVTGRLWMTENGEKEYDEINYVRPGFNSGWHKLTGPMGRSNVTENDLVVLDGSQYYDPAFSWLTPVGVTDIEFFGSDKFGTDYENDVFVGDINNGNLYFFHVNEPRDGFELGQDGLADLVADDSEELSAIMFGKGFDGITDIETGPDGYLYILSYFDGRIYKITTNQ
jgi:glucose/arabinose dehydrogenase